ncbi:MAG: HAD-IIA family hydrolase [Anaerolineales bacterium]|nr:HAD-IIA family hydrolase [Anaerolineales bacterium]
MNINGKKIKALILDMDGVLWKADQEIGNLKTIFALLKKKGYQYTFATNNSTRTIQMYVEKIQGFGVPVEPWQIVTSATATAEFVAMNYPKEAKVYVFGERGIQEAILDKGFLMSDDYAEIDLVVAGMNRNVSYENMSIATLAIRNGAGFIGTNPDKTFPTPNGPTPGTGTFVTALETATDVKAIIIGKPKAAMFEQLADRLNLTPGEILVVGDRIETDIAGGQNAGMPSCLVLTGISSKEEGQTWRPQIDLTVIDLETLVKDIL